MLIRVEALLPGAGAAAVAPAAVRIEAGRIVAVGVPSALPPAAGEPCFDLPGRTLLPGLVDAHDHLLGFRPDPIDSEADEASVLRALIASQECSRHLDRGVTSVRVLGSEVGLDLGLKRAISERVVDGPRIQTAGRAITNPDGRNHMTVGVSAPRKLGRRSVSRSGMGPRLIKLMASGGIVAISRGEDPHHGGLTRDELMAASEAAHDAGLRVAAHAIGVAAIEDALDADADTIEHGIGLTSEQAARMAARGAVLVPTLSTYRRIASRGAEIGLPTDWSQAAAQLVAVHVESVRHAIEQGAMIAVGSDGLGDVIEEIAALVDLGVRPIDAIDMASRGGARAMGMADRIGAIHPGYVADFAVVNGRPELDVSVLSAMDAVLLEGRLRRRGVPDEPSGP